MDISRLLCPRSDLPPQKILRSAESVDTGAQVEALSTRAANTASTSPRDQETTAFREASSSALPQAPPAGLKRSADRRKQQPPVACKRKRRFSAKELQIRHENQHDESQLYNLTLDVNELKRQVRDLLVRKSIYETRAMVNQQRFDSATMRSTQRLFSKRDSLGVVAVAHYGHSPIMR